MTVCRWTPSRMEIITSLRVKPELAAFLAAISDWEKATTSKADDAIMSGLLRPWPLSHSRYALAPDAEPLLLLDPTTARSYPLAVHRVPVRAVTLTGGDPGHPALLTLLTQFRRSPLALAPRAREHGVALALADLHPRKSSPARSGTQPIQCLVLP